MIHSKLCRFRTKPIRALAICAACVVAAGCGSDDGSDDGSAGGTANDSPAAFDVVASFYPLQFVAEQVGGSFVTVSNLTPAGAEPRDLELTARDTASLQEADVVL